jgi:adenylate cyclase
VGTDSIDFAAEGLLDGLEGRAREERRELLERLYADGVTLDELRDAVDERRLLFLPAERLAGGVPRYTARELAERGGIGVDFFLAVVRALGLPVPDADEPAFTEADLGAGALLRAFGDIGLSEEQMLATARVLGRGMSQGAEQMRAVALELSLQAGQSEVEFAHNYTAQVGRLMPLVGPLLEGVARLHLRHAVDTELIDATERATGMLPGARDVAVAFADLVGFTRLGEQVGPEDLDRIARRLETLTAEHLVAPVRLVKTIGDAVMLVSADADALLRSVLDLVDAADAEGEDFPQLHVGVAAGPALSRGGDWYGRPVNLASRVTALARPGSVLVSEEVRDAVTEGAADWSYAGQRKVKGVPEPVRLFRARRPGATEGDGPPER